MHTLVYLGKTCFLTQGRKQLIHLEIYFLPGNQESKNNWLSLYHSTEKLKRNQLDSKGIASFKK